MIRRACVWVAALATVAVLAVPSVVAGFVALGVWAGWFRRRLRRREESRVGLMCLRLDTRQVYLYDATWLVIGEPEVRPRWLQVYGAAQAWLAQQIAHARLPRRS